MTTMVFQLGVSVPAGSWQRSLPKPRRRRASLSPRAAVGGAQ
ncbi:MAG: hypothetical protein PGN12_01530 [Sphingomonas phyllosphaerae]